MLKLETTAEINQSVHLPHCTDREIKLSDWGSNLQGKFKRRKPRDSEASQESRNREIKFWKKVVARIERKGIEGYF